SRGYVASTSPSRKVMPRSPFRPPPAPPKPARSSFQSGFQYFIREELSRLGGHFLGRNHDDTLVSVGSVRYEKLLTDIGGPAGQVRDFFIDRRRQFDAAHFGAHNSIVEFSNQMCG